MEIKIDGNDHDRAKYAASPSISVNSQSKVVRVWIGRIQSCHPDWIDTNWLGPADQVAITLYDTNEIMILSFNLKSIMDHWMVGWIIDSCHYALLPRVECYKISIQSSFFSLSTHPMPPFLTIPKFDSSLYVWTGKKRTSGDGISWTTRGDGDRCCGQRHRRTIAYMRRWTWTRFLGRLNRATAPHRWRQDGRGRGRWGKRGSQTV